MERRLNYLNHKLTDGRHGENEVGYLRAEISALEWAIPILEAAIGNEPRSPLVGAQWAAEAHRPARRPRFFDGSMSPTDKPRETLAKPSQV